MEPDRQVTTSKNFRDVVLGKANFSFRFGFIFIHSKRISAPQPTKFSAAVQNFFATHRQLPLTAVSEVASASLLLDDLAG